LNQEENLQSSSSKNHVSPQQLPAQTFSSQSSIQQKYSVEPITGQPADHQPELRQKVEFYLTKDVPKGNGVVAENAVAKVKITHLELPFGQADGKTADDALNILNKLTKSEKGKIKIIRSKTGGFTLSGLPSKLSEIEVNQVAKGLASVMEEKKKKQNSNDSQQNDQRKSNRGKQKENKKGKHENKNTNVSKTDKDKFSQKLHENGKQQDEEERNTQFSADEESNSDKEPAEEAPEILSKESSKENSQVVEGGLEEAIEKLKATFNIKNKFSQSAHMSLGEKMEADHPGRMDLKETGTSFPVDIQKVEMVAKHPGRLDLKEEKTDVVNEGVENKNIPEDFFTTNPQKTQPQPEQQEQQNVQNTPTGSMGKIPMSQSVMKQEPIVASPWYSWNHAAGDGLIDLKQPGGGSHHGVGLPDHGHESLISPLSHKEPFIESVSLVGNAMDLRPKIGTTPPPVFEQGLQSQIKPTQPSPQQENIYLGGDSIGTPVSDTIPGSLLGVGNEQPPDQQQTMVPDQQQIPIPEQQTPGTKEPDGLLQNQAKTNSFSGLTDKSLEISRLNDFDILDVDLESVNKLNSDMISTTNNQQIVRCKYLHVLTSKVTSKQILCF